MTDREQIKELLYKWGTSPIITMEAARKAPEGDWNSDNPGCYRIIKDPRCTLDLWVTLYVGEAGALHSRSWYHRKYRQYWVQMIVIPNLGAWPVDWHFRREVEKGGAARFKPIEGDHAQKYKHYEHKWMSYDPYYD
jgi:hypothetical protein